MTERVAWNVLTFRRVRSTQERAQKLAMRGFPEGTVVVALEQTAGRGRLGRSWVSPRGGLYLSAILRPNRKTKFELVPFLGALAAIDGIRLATGVTCSLRWPNDIVAEGKKLGGVIAEASFSNTRLTHIILGIGVNCNTGAYRLREASGESTTLVDLSRAETDLTTLRSAILDSLARYYLSWLGRKDRPLNAMIRKSLSTLGRTVHVGLSEGEFSGRAEMITDDESLVVRAKRRRLVIRTEDLRWLREE